MAKTEATLQGVEVRPGVYDIDPAHSTIGAVARHLMITKVRGRFQDFTGSITVGDAPGLSGAEITIGAASIDTGEQRRDDHLRSPDFLDVEQFPTLRFTTTSVVGDTDRFVVEGDLTIRDVTRPITIDARLEGALVDLWGKERVTLSGRATLDREAYGMTWNQALETGGVLVSKKFDIELEVSATRRDA